MLNESLIRCYKNREIEPQLALIAGDVILPVQSVREYAHEHHYSERHVQLLCDTGRLQAVKLNGCWYILQTPVEKIIAPER